MGNKKSMTYPDGTTYSFTYNPNNQLATYQIPGQGLITYQYRWTRPSQVVYPGGVTRTVGYDAAMRTKRIQVKDPGGNAVMDYSYTYDHADNITTKETEHGKYEYGYDNTYQLTQAISPAPAPAGVFTNRLEGFTYDKVGNRLQKLTDLLVTTASYNQNNELEQSGDITYEHDSNGNLTGKVEGGVTTTYSYDVENRLVEVTDTKGLRAEYQYDPFGRRLTKTVTTSSGTTQEHFYYGDEGLIAEATGAGVITKTYGWQPDGVWGTDPVLMNVTASAGEANGYHLYLNDHLATPQKMVATSGAVSWSAIYEGFGKATIDAATVTNNLRFPGQYQDAETRSHYNWHRYYDPAQGQYAQSDPIGLLGGVNTYQYSRSSPLIYIDPTGLEWQFTVGISGSAGVAPVFVPGIFLGGGMNAGFTSSGQLIWQSQGSVSTGQGLFFGVGLQGGISKTKCQTKGGLSIDRAIQAEFNIGHGPSAGGSLQYNPKEKSGGASVGVGRIGAGYGAQASVGVVRTVTLATPALFGKDDPDCRCAN